jgi:hypothetical protein
LPNEGGRSRQRVKIERNAGDDDAREGHTYLSLLRRYPVLVAIMPNV